MNPFCLSDIESLPAIEKCFEPFKMGRTTEAVNTIKTFTECKENKYVLPLDGELRYVLLQNIGSLVPIKDF